MCSTAGYYPSLFSSGAVLSLEGGSKSSSVDDLSREKLTEAVKSLTLTPFTNLDDVVTPPFRVATSDGVFLHTNSDHEEDPNSSDLFQSCQLMWEISAHTEKTSDQESSRMFPELVLTDSSFLSTTMIQDDVNETENNQKQNTVKLKQNPAVFELLTDENEPISSFQTDSLEPSVPPEESIFSPRIQTRPRTNPQEDLVPQKTLNPTSDNNRTPKIGCTSSSPTHPVVRTKQDDQQSFDRQQMLRKASIQVQLELHKIEASTQEQMQSIEDGLLKAGGTTPRCSFKTTLSNTISRLSRAVYHCCHRKQSKKEKELMKKMRENCNRMQQLSPSASPSGVRNSACSPSSSYHQRRYALMKKRLEGMINSTSEEGPTPVKRSVDRDMLKLDLRKVHGSDPEGTTGCLPTSGRRSLTSRYKKSKTGSRISAKTKTGSRISAKTKTGSRISAKTKTGSRVSAKSKTGLRNSAKTKTGSRSGTEQKTGLRISTNQGQNSFPARSAKTKDSSSSKNRSSV